MSSAKKKPVVSVRGGKLLSTPRDDLFIVRVGIVSEAKTPSDQMAAKLLGVAGLALDKQGISRHSVFRSQTGRRVYAYSLDPTNPDLLVREDVEGNKAVGRMVNGHFRKLAVRA